ncbi:uncharacterized protein LOC105388630 isoform X2 [Plutella xylostella]|uniref:uncharacterized protein LOC105388630 isoform X2 n=1 Tax=Plutella xylostella TaxID=51655 RepID=UPI0018CFF94B|nr:uncharacterized protein LOC105388630 isoform X2 [Plutella xylostella]
MIYSRPWTILILLMAIKMVLCGCVLGAGADAYGNATRVRREPHPHHRPLTDEEDAAAAWKRGHWREMQAIMRSEGARGVAECCPSVLEMVAPKGGRTPSGLFVELYEDGENIQQLYELSCAPDIVGRPCRFVDARLYNQSRCVQKYSYSYALVRKPAATEIPQHRARREGQGFSVPGAGGWSMDYVRVRSGCECQITPPKRKTPHKKRERHRQKKKNRRLEEEDET